MSNVRGGMACILISPLFAEIWVVNFYLNHCTCIAVMKGWLNLQTWWFCGIKNQLHESIHSKPQYKRVHCSWKANAMTSRETLQRCEVLVKNKVLLDQHQLHINCIFHSSQAQPTLWLLQGTGDMRSHIPVFCTPPQLHLLDSLFTLYHLLWEHWREPF
jgi:hypothetical protein